MSLDQFLTPAYPAEIQQIASDLENIVNMYQLGQMSEAEYQELLSDVADAEKVLAHVHDIEQRKVMVEMLEEIVKFAKGVIPL